MYYAYCAVKFVMDVLIFCADSSNWEMLGTLKVRQSSVANVTGSSIPDRPNKDSTRTNMETFQQVRLNIAGFLGISHEMYSET